jgi:hypothetical protein
MAAGPIFHDEDECGAAWSGFSTNGGKGLNGRRKIGLLIPRY